VGPWSLWLWTCTLDLFPSDGVGGGMWWSGYTYADGYLSPLPYSHPHTDAKGAAHRNTHTYSHSFANSAAS